MVITSKYNKIELVLTGWDEPNNGRMLQVADLYIDETLRNEEYFGIWNRLDQNIEYYQMDSLDGRYVYIPAEGGGFLIETTSSKKIPLPYKALSTLTFIKNEFIEGFLVITHSDEIITVNLENLKTKRFEHNTIL